MPDGTTGLSTSAPTKPRRRVVRRVAMLALALAALGGAAVYGIDWWTDARFVQTTDDAYVGGNVTAVSPHVAGFVAEIAVTDNQRVTAGQRLLRLDARDFEAARDHAAAAWSARIAALGELQERLAMQQAVIRQREAELDGKTARVAFTGQDVERYRTLAQTSAGSRQDAQRTAALDLEARAALEASSASLEAERKEVRVLNAQIQQAGAAVAQANADLHAAELNLGYTDIRAPIDGFIGNRAAQEGAYVAQGAYLLSVIPSQGIWVDANFKEDQLARMKPGQPATVVADVLPGHTFKGRVASLAPGTGAVFSVIPPENATGNFTKIVQRVPVRIVLDADDELVVLRPGLSATVSVGTK
jgi:membrane fusion protein (multidrug efflux system)